MLPLFSLTVAPASRAPKSRARLGPQFADVLSAAQVGAEWAWTKLYRSVAPGLLAYLRANGANDPDNLLGDVFLQLARNLSGFSGDEDGFRAWAFMIAHHRIVDERRQARRRPAQPVADVPDAPGGSSEDEAIAALAHAEARAALEHLTPEQREVITLRIFADLSLEEVSRITQRPVSAVKALQRRALAQLKKQFSADPYPDGGDRR